MTSSALFRLFWILLLCLAAVAVAVLFIRPDASPSGPLAVEATTPSPPPDPLDWEVAALPYPAAAAPASSDETPGHRRREAMRIHGATFREKAVNLLRANPLPQEDLDRLTPRPYLSAAEFPLLELPLQTGHASYEWVARALAEGILPSLAAIRVEELLNHFTIQPAGPTAIAEGVSLSCETLSCPWKPSSVLLLLHLRGAAQADRAVNLQFAPDPVGVNRYRLLGFATSRHPADLAIPTLLPAGVSTTLAIEIEPRHAATSLGSLNWSVSGQAAAGLAVAFQPDAEPSDDARFATLVCTWAQWLNGEQAGIIDAELVAALAREIASEDLKIERQAFLGLVDRSLHR